MIKTGTAQISGRHDSFGECISSKAAGKEDLRPQLLDLSVDENGRERLKGSPFRAVVRIQIKSTTGGRHPNFLNFLGQYSQGRSAIYGVDKNNVLVIVFSVHEVSAEEARRVETFATAMADYLAVGDTAVLTTEISHAPMEKVEPLKRPVLSGPSGSTQPQISLVKPSIAPDPNSDCDLSTAR